MSIRSVPNEFDSYKHPTLEIPEASEKLPVPTHGKEPKTEVSPEEQAKRALD
ncbi:MAG: DUF3035 domain-containing protein [Alphaproteobacteria bacterium]